MDLYKIENEKVKFLKPSAPKNEKELQELIENNLKDLFELTFIASELELQRKELDTLAFDEENSRVVIIEYKLGSDSGVFDQGMAYLMLAHEKNGGRGCLCGSCRIWENGAKQIRLSLHCR